MNYQKLIEEALSLLDTPPGSPIAGGGPNEAQKPAGELLGPVGETSEDARSPEGDLALLGLQTERPPSLDGLEANERPVYLRVWDHPLSPGTRYRLLQKMKRLERRKVSKKLHYKTRRKKRREKYQRVERASKLRRDKWLTSCPDGLFLYYKRIAKRKGAAWLFTREEFTRLLETEHEGVPIYQLLFNLVRIDKKLGYSRNNVVVLDRYTKARLDSPST